MPKVRAGSDNENVSIWPSRECVFSIPYDRSYPNVYRLGFGGIFLISELCNRGAGRFGARKPGRTVSVWFLPDYFHRVVVHTASRSDASRAIGADATGPRDSFGAGGPDLYRGPECCRVLLDQPLL